MRPRNLLRTIAILVILISLAGVLPVAGFPLFSVSIDGADLSISIADDPDPVLVGRALTYTLTVTNNGPDAATGVTTTDALPGGVTFVSATSTAGKCAESSGVVTCFAGALDIGETVTTTTTTTTTVVVIPTATGVITNTASVSGDELDPDSTNNTATSQTTVVGGADLSISKADDPDPVLVGDVLTYTLAVTNDGPSTSTAVALTDALPSERRLPAPSS